VTWADPLPGARASRGLSGREYLEGIIRGTFSRPPIAVLLGLVLEEVEEGRAVFSVTPAEYHYNPNGLVHGGLLATVLDSALGCAVHSTLPRGMGYATLELKVNYLRAVTSRTGPLRCEAHVVHAGRRAALAEGAVADSEGRLYAHGTTTCLKLEAEEP
jgi:uncharacterized protein (TIGR00369 family)